MNSLKQTILKNSGTSLLNEQLLEEGFWEQLSRFLENQTLARNTLEDRIKQGTWHVLNFISQNPMTVIASLGLAVVLVFTKSRFTKIKAEKVFDKINAEREDAGLPLIPRSVLKEPKAFLKRNQERIKNKKVKEKLQDIMD